MTLLLVVLSSVYGPNERVVYVRDAIASLESSSLERLTDAAAYIDVMDRNECRSIYHRLRAQCLIDVAKKRCRSERGRKRRRACALASDIIVTNKLSENQFITTMERFLIMRQHEKFRDELRVQLRRRYGTLVTAFSLSGHYDCADGDRECLATGIVDYCAEYADTHSLSWQHCAAAMTWFIGTTREGDRG